MKRWTTQLLGALLLTLVSALAAAQQQPQSAQPDPPPPPGKIAITFDDLPVVRSYNASDRWQITESILSELSAREIKAAGFVIGDNIEGDWEILGRWLEDGHTLGNHTFSHHDLHVTDPDLFIPDMIKGAEVIEGFLSGFGQKKRYFRFPYLHQGRDKETSGRIFGLLKEQNITVAHVSVDTDDYLYNLTMETLRKSTDTLKLNSLRDEYIEHIVNALLRAEELGRRVAGRAVKHILLLHANRLNGRYLGPLLDEIQRAGYEFISFEEAIKDPIYKKKDSYFGAKGISKLERVARSNPDYIPSDY